MLPYKERPAKEDRLTHSLFSMEGVPRCEALPRQEDRPKEIIAFGHFINKVNNSHYFYVLFRILQVVRVQRRKL
jgi:hypothetical protein